MTFRKEYETLWELTSGYLMQLSPQEQLRYMAITSTTDLQLLYAGALRQEDYEVCNLVKNEVLNRDVINEL